MKIVYAFGDSAHTFGCAQTVEIAQSECEKKARSTLHWKRDTGVADLCASSYERDYWIERVRWFGEERCK